MNTAWTHLAILSRITLNVFGVHRSVNELGGFADANTVLLLELVQEDKEQDEAALRGGVNRQASWRQRTGPSHSCTHATVAPLATNTPRTADKPV